jgi:tetratricopeptide (TPR) repeat protein
MRSVLFSVSVLAIVACTSAAKAQDSDEALKICNSKEPTHKPDQVIAGCTAAIRGGAMDNHNLAILYSNRSSAYREKGDHEAAIQDADEAIRLDPQNAAAFVNRGNAYEDEHLHEQALQDYNRAIELDPNDSRAYANRGLLYQELKQDDRAKGDLDRAVELDPHDPVALTNRGTYYSERQKYDLAIADFDEAIRADSHYANAYAGRGWVELKKHDFDAAGEDAQRSIDEDSTVVAGYELRGDIDSDEGDHLGAIDEYEVAVQLKPDDAYAWNNLCFEQAIFGRTTEALDSCNRSLRLRPREPNTMDSRGFAYLKLKKADAAITDFNSALRLDPKIYTSLYGRGLAKRLKGNTTGANADIAAAKKLHPSVVSELASEGFPPEWPATKKTSVPPMFHFTVDNQSSHAITAVSVSGSYKWPRLQRRGDSAFFEVIEEHKKTYLPWIDPGALVTVDVGEFEPSAECSYYVSVETKDGGSGAVGEKNICSKNPVVITDADLHFPAPPEGISTTQ